MVRVSGYLEQRRAGWVAVRDVPPSLRAAVGSSRLRKGLGTRDVHVARARLLKVLVEFENRIQTAAGRRPDTDPVNAEAMAIRENVLAIRRGDLRSFGSTPQYSRDDDGEWREDDPREFALGIISENVQERSEAIERTEGRNRAQAFADSGIDPS